ncbi:MAG: glycosaminoglycan attachment protein [Chloroflexota bacterium]
MDSARMKSLTRFQFQAFGQLERPPAYHFLVEEHEWYADDTENTLGVLFRDKIDDDWAYVVMRRGPDSKFRCVEVDSSFETIETARIMLLSEIDRVSREIEQTGVSTSKAIADLVRSINGRDPFKPIVPTHRRNSLYKVVAEHEAYSPARGMIREVYDSYVDLDGNFIEQFQTTGFDSRIWELYLHAYLVDAEFSLLPSVRPDFVVSKGGITLGIEAVTANPTQNLQLSERDNGYPSVILHTPPFDYKVPVLDASFVEKEKDFVPIKLGSALYSKLKKHYWELDNMTERPIIFAIETFHDRESLHYSSVALGTYLYGYHHEHLWDPDGRLIIVPRKVDSHVYAGKTIPSGFFSLPEAKHVSAVLFSNSGTISKFNRMGQMGRHRNPRIRLIRQGTCYNPDPNASTPAVFAYEVGDPRYQEWWGQGLEMFHNPVATHLVDRWLFPGIVHHRFEDGMIYTEAPEFHPIASFTINIAGTRRGDSFELGDAARD